MTKARQLVASLVDQAERVGFQLQSENPMKQGIPENSAAECAAVPKPCPKLAFIASVWDHLPDDIREQILDIALSHAQAEHNGS